MDKEIIHKELDLIQGIIMRMASNSFEVKKWLIGILTAIIVFKHDELIGGNNKLIWVLLIPILAFWYLDAFFISIERAYREMYKWVIKYRNQTDKYLYDLNTMSREFPVNNTENLILKKNNVWSVMLSKTVWPFYIVPFIFVAVLGIMEFLNDRQAACCCH